MATNRTSPKKGKVVDIPTAPTIGAATGGAGSASVAFTSVTVGGPTFSYTALSNPGSITGTGTTSPITVSGLTAGTSYTFTVRGTNPSGNSEYTSASNSVVPTVITAFESIATVSLSSSAASVTFSSIPATYTHLQVRAIILGTGAISYQPMTFNSDTGSNYTNHGITGTGAGTPSAFGEANHGFISHQDAVATNPFAMVMDILDYANTNKYKTVRTLGGYDANGSGTVTFRSGLWRNTNAITTIKIEPNTNNYAQYSHFALYGIKGA